MSDQMPPGPVQSDLVDIIARLLHEQTGHRNRATCGPRNHRPLAERLLEGLAARHLRITGEQRQGHCINCCWAEAFSQGRDSATEEAS